MKPFTAIAATTCALTLTSCSLFETLTSRPQREAPIASEHSYLQGGPNTDIELGSDERTLLEEYKTLHDTKVQLETKLSEVQADNAQLRTQLLGSEEEREKFRNHLAGSNQENERAAQRVRDLESKVLSLTIERTHLEQELLRLRISSLQQEYEELVATTPAAPDGSSR